VQGALVHPVEAGFVTVHQGRCRVLRKSLPGLAWRIVVAVTPMFAQAASEAHQPAVSRPDQNIGAQVGAGRPNQSAPFDTHRPKSRLVVPDFLENRAHQHWSEISRLCDRRSV